jgi:hypothetical protein
MGNARVALSSELEFWFARGVRLKKKKGTVTTAENKEGRSFGAVVCEIQG